MSIYYPLFIDNMYFIGQIIVAFTIQTAHSAFIHWNHCHCLINYYYYSFVLNPDIILNRASVFELEVLFRWFPVK